VKNWAIIAKQFYAFNNGTVYTEFLSLSIPVAVRSKLQVCGRSITGIAGSNTAEDMDVILLCLLCVV
jgi:hypothetical protein